MRSMAFVGLAVAFAASHVSAQVIEDWSSGGDAAWFRGDFLTSPPGPLPLGGTSFTVAAGEYTMASNLALPPLPAGLGAASLFIPSLADPVFTNGAIRTVVRLNNDQTNAFILARGNLDGGTFYNLAFGTGGDGASLAINRFTGFVNSTTLATSPVSPFIAGQNYNVEFGFVGALLTGRIWAVGDAEPALPQVSVIDASYPAGGIGIGMTATANTPGAISATYGTIAFVPAPGAGLFVAAACAISGRRRRR